MKVCEYCIEESCNGKHDCKCSECKKASQCPRVLRPTVRITNRCTQKCMHCCFSSHPGSKLMMSVETAKDVSQFLLANEIPYVNVMGGEFFCNPEWETILHTLARAVKVIRLVTNSDWAGNEKVEVPLRKFIEEHKDKLRICLSKDKWHNNKGVPKAEEFLKSTGVTYNIETPEEGRDSTIVPVGRGELAGAGSFYRALGMYCTRPDRKYTFLIDEEGDIYKCDFGIIQFANVKDEDFCKAFKEINQKFYKLPVLSCGRCIRALRDNSVRRE